MIRDIIKKMVEDEFAIPYGFMVSPDEFDYIRAAEKEKGMDLLPEEKDIF